VVWQKKAAAPAYARFLDRLKADVTGSAEAWTLPFLDQLSDYVVDVNAFCAAGPEECESLDAFDFIGFLPRPSWVGAGLTALGLQNKLACFGRNRLFGAWCENVVASGTWSDWFNATVCANHTTLGNWDTGIVAVPAGSTQYRITFSDVTVWLYHGWQQRIIFYTDAGGSGRVDYNDGTPPTDPSAGFTTGIVNIPAGHGFFRIMLLAADAAEVCGGVRIEFNGGGTSPYVPPLVTAPPSAVAPAPGVYPDIASLGVKLDEIEEKLHNVIYNVTQLVINDFPVTHEPVTAPVDATNAEVPLDDDVIGVLVTVSNAAPYADVRFGAPYSYHRLGRLVIGTVNGWGTPLDITVSPMLVWDLPPHPTRMAVYVAPPATATVQPLRRAVGPVG
jgi:hypothetical protein